MNMKNVIAGIFFFSFLTISTGAFSAEPSPLKFNRGDTLQATLGRHVGNRVELVLKSGQSMTGIIKEVGTAVVHLSQLAGKEYFDALIRIDHISAAVIRVKKS